MNKRRGKKVQTYKREQILTKVLHSILSLEVRDELYYNDMMCMDRVFKRHS